MRILTASLFIVLLATTVHAGPQYIDVTAEKPQKHIHVTPSSLGEGFWAFSIDVSMENVELPDDLGAYLILQNAKGNLLSTVIKSSRIDSKVINFYAAVHSDLLQWAQVDVRDNMTVYSIKLNSFLKIAQRTIKANGKPQKSQPFTDTGREKSCYDTAKTQRDLNECASLELKEADEELNKVYKEIVKRNGNDKVFLERLKAAQRAWLTFRDAELETLFPEADKQIQYGSSYPMCYAKWKVTVTEERTQQLKKWIAGVSEGDICSGSLPVK